MTEYIWVNDAYLIPFYLKGIGIGLVLLFLMLLCHELGHALWFLIYKKKVIKLRWEKGVCEAGTIEDYRWLNDKEYMQVNMYGIMAGIIILLIATAFHPIWFLLVFPYAVAVRQDIGEVVKLVEWEND